MSNICEYELVLHLGWDFIEVGQKPSKSYYTGYIDYLYLTPRLTNNDLYNNNYYIIPNLAWRYLK